MSRSDRARARVKAAWVAAGTLLGRWPRAQTMWGRAGRLLLPGIETW